MDSTVLIVFGWLTIMSIGTIIMVVFLRKFANQERMAMIEKNMEPISFNNSSRYATLKAALLLIGAGIGLFMGYSLDMLFGMEEVAYFSMLLIFGGLGLLVAYRVEGSKEA